MSRTEYQKEYKKRNKEKLNKYRRAWMRLKRKNPDYIPEFPEDIKNISRGQFKPRIKPRKKKKEVIKKGHCLSCSSVLKSNEIKICSWCSKRYTHT